MWNVKVKHNISVFKSKVVKLPIWQKKKNKRFFFSFHTILRRTRNSALQSIWQSADEKLAQLWCYPIPQVSYTTVCILIYALMNLTRLQERDNPVKVLLKTQHARQR